MRPKAIFQTSRNTVRAHPLKYLEHVEMAVDSGVVAGRLVPVAAVRPGPLKDIQVSSGGSTSAGRPEALHIF